MPPEPTFALHRAVRQQLESLARAGIFDLPICDASDWQPAATILTETASNPLPNSPLEPATPVELSQTANPTRRDEEQLQGTAPAAAENVKDASRLRTKADELQVLQELVSRCTRCAELAATRTQTVFGVGNSEARLVFFGEAPGADEDRQGEPFVGRAGQLLTKMIEACTLKREEVYILNTLKCRPPGNRNPESNELENCRGYWERQLEIIQPEFICCLGRFAVQTLLNSTQSVGKMRGRFHTYRGIKVIVTYHPAYLLRNPEAKRPAWEDLQMLMKEMGINVAKS